MKKIVYLRFYSNKTSLCDNRIKNENIIVFIPNYILLNCINIIAQKDRRWYPIECSFVLM